MDTAQRLCHNARMSRHLITVLLLAAFAAALLARRAGQDREANLATRPIEYRVSGYFPPGFPLHGKVKLLSAAVAETGQRTPVRVEYTVGDMPIETGMALEIWKHFTSDAEQLQVDDPAAPAFFSAKFSRPEVRGTTRAFTNWTVRDAPAVFPYRKVAAVTLEAGRLAAGDRVLFDIGGAQGVRMQYYEENLFNYRVVITRENKVLGYGGDALMKITGGPARRLKAQAPSIVAAGEEFLLEVVPQDEWGSLAKDRERLKLEMRAEGLPARPLEYDREMMHYVARNLTASREGVLRIRVRSADGRLEALSNPIWVERAPPHRVFYGDLHQHTYLHDGRGVYDELYLYGRRVGLLDFGALSEHHMPMSVTGPSFYLDRRWPSENWPDIQRAARLFNGWKGFVSILGYEYSVGTNLGGHHNVYFNADEAKSTMQIDPAEPAAPIAKMLRTVQLVRRPALVIPHIGGGPPDWSHPTDPRIERLFEIASVHGVFEESWQRHLENGLRLAASAAGDTHTTMMGNANPGLIYAMTNALTGVYAQGKTRQEIWDGMYQRRTFAVSGNTRIVMDFRVNGEPMGGELPSGHSQAAEVEARISGTAPITSVELLKNSRVIHAVAPARQAGSRLLRVVWGDNIYQRRAAQGLRSGEVHPSGGRLRLVQPIHLDQGFESLQQRGDGISWSTAAVSNDRDGFLADISETSGDALVFRFADADTVGNIEVRIPLDQLRRTGHFAWSTPANWKHPYMDRMRVAPAFFLECELVSPAAPMDVNFTYKDLGPLKPGDYYYIRMEQLDTNKGWSSPVWVN